MGNTTTKDTLPNLFGPSQRSIPINIHHLSSQIADSYANNDLRRYDIAYVACLKAYAQNKSTSTTLPKWTSLMTKEAESALRSPRSKKHRGTPRIQSSLVYLK